ncbi:transcriptional regulator, GntR family [Tranquillimonas rosea]|uniref:Transcriptional regulator, GntR family n=1 Tax=Tranquillimonas rosea TaxID=641238 RepID=A0A1H9X904_9RHOB|nr:FCD domain-containing protein [Tranquillimonas rosea]SES42604.1 transcriptional regulator, GntR family [Tranquillimonas rosea]
MLQDLTSHAHSILSGMLDAPEWASGGKLPPETELARQVGVSRPVLRKAIALLREEGRIVSRRGSGNFVQPRVVVGTPSVEFRALSIRTVHDMKNCMRFRQIVEMAAAEDAARIGDSAAIDDIARANAALAAYEGTSVFDADFNFHLAIARASKNSYYEVALETLRSQIALGLEFGRKLRGVPMNEVSQRVVDEHEDIIAALRSGDLRRVHVATERHLAQGIQRLFGEEA